MLNYIKFSGALYSVHDLTPARKYTFRFAAVNEVGLSPWGKSETRQMPDQSPPSEPIITNAQDDGARFIKLDTANYFELKWKIPSSNGLDIDSYQLKYCTVSVYEYYEDNWPIRSIFMLLSDLFQRLPKTPKIVICSQSRVHAWIKF